MCACVCRECERENADAHSHPHLLPTPYSRTMVQHSDSSFECASPSSFAPASATLLLATSIAVAPRFWLF